MSTAQRLQVAALGLLWLQLVWQGQLQPQVAVALPLLLVLACRPAAPTPLLRHSLTAAGLLLWAAGAALGDRTALLQSGCNLVWLLSGLKLLEARSKGERRLVSLLLLLGIGLAGLGQQALGPSLMQGATALVALAALLSLESQGQPWGPVLQRSGQLVAWALPLLIATFVLMPRLEPLWSLPLASAGRSGLSERLAPGELAALVQDNALAARVSFEGGAPPPAMQRYWRVLVHQRFDGASWSSASTSSPLARAGSTPVNGSKAHLSTKDKPEERWMVEPLELPQRPWSGQASSAGTGLQTTPIGTVVGPGEPGQRRVYRLQRLTGPAAWQQRPPTADDLQLPPAANPRLRALGAQWQRQASTPEGRLQLARSWYLQQGFRYTLEPGALGSINPLDGFLFETRAGFCEHFAASFSALMRAAGVPARVVVGYQGGSWQQPIGTAGYLELRNSDAHAWSEIWLPEHGWLRVDPTGWVVPERLRRSLAASLSPADRARLSQPMPRWLQGLGVQWRGLDYRWQLWVMGFDRQRQRSLLGDGPWQGLLALVLMAAALGLGLLPPWLQQQRRDPIARGLQRLLLQLARQGDGLRRGESLQQYGQRLAPARPQLAAALQELADQHAQWRFGPGAGSTQQRRAMVTALKRCRAALASPQS
ncbi:MAG: DUF3488 and transglutaminase-like domain-containing protein [Cyanobacteriota bacterium]|nr:DUF3488 and transglutaminase-like domain-containing protein [Cyanobacteriota bacterium]